ncbi:MAG: CHASE3 domain-containing protein [Terriglobia bacterium]
MKYGLRRVQGKLNFLLLGIAGLALFAILVVQIENYREIAQARHLVALTVIALQDAENVTSLVRRAETTQRGYLLTGSAEYLAPYHAALREIPAARGDLDNAARAIDLDPGLLRTLQNLIDAKLQEMGKLIELYRRDGPAQALALVRTNAGFRVMNKIEQISRRLKRDATGQFSYEADRLAKHNREALVISLFGIAIVLFVLILATVRLARSFQYNARLIARYRSLARKLESVREEERAHLAREIHDTLGQALSVIKLNVALAARQMTADMALASNTLGQTTNSVDKTIQSLRAVAKRLRPPLLDAAGVGPALEEYLRELQGETRLSIQFSADPELPGLAGEKAAAVFRICQEALTNILRHADASEVSIRLQSDRESLKLAVQDNGCGFAWEQAKDKSLGLLGMQERATLIGAHLEIASERGAGTTVTLLVPVQAKTTAA